MSASRASAVGSCSFVPLTERVLRASDLVRSPRTSALVVDHDSHATIGTLVDSVNPAAQPNGADSRLRDVLFEPDGNGAELSPQRGVFFEKTQVSADGPRFVLGIYVEPGETTHFPGFGKLVVNNRQHLHTVSIVPGLV